MLDERTTESRGNTFRGNRLVDGPEPSDPTLRQRANQLLGHLEMLSSHQYNIRHKLLGVGPECSNGGASKEKIEPPLADLLGMACERAALLCGEAATIQERL